MSKFRVRQLRSGEGAILTHLSNLQASELPRALPELFEGRVLLVAGAGLGGSAPQGGERVADAVWILRGKDATRFLAESDPVARRGLIWAICEDAPGDEVLSRCVPNPERPWDHERLEAQAYGQFGKAYAIEGVWFRDEQQRRHWVEAALSRLLEAAGTRLPTGDATIVLELPTDSTFDAEFNVRGKGDGLRIKRDFGNHGFVREWRIETGEWIGEETRRPKSDDAPLGQRVTQAVATAGIFLLSLPVSIFVALVLLTTKLSDGSSSTSRAANAGPGGSGNAD